MAKAKAKATSIVTTMAGIFCMEQQEMLDSLMATVLKVKHDEPKPTRGEMGALLVVCREHGLNPFKKEIYAFRTKSGGLQPIVPIDGWTNIINSHPAFDGLTTKEVVHPEFGLGVETTIHRKDRKVATVSTEWMNECKGTSVPWTKWPMRMLRWKSIIQCARVAFSLSGIMDEDEGDRLREAEAEIIDNDAMTDAVRGALPVAPAQVVGGDAADTFKQPVPVVAEPKLAVVQPITVGGPTGPEPVKDRVTQTPADDGWDTPEHSVDPPTQQAPAPAPAPLAEKVTKQKIMGNCTHLGYKKADLLDLINDVIGIHLKVLTDLTEPEGQAVLDWLLAEKDRRKEEVDDERAAIAGEGGEG